ncbi:MAG: hypothetical protein AB4911_01515 [Oscillochloridaceae bacterium umkhey_bin13]
MILLVYTFDHGKRATEARVALERLDRQLGEPNGHFAVVQKDAAGRISLREPADLGQEVATVAASVVGGVTWFVYTFVGLMGTPPALIAEQVTDETSRRLVRDSGFPNHALHAIGVALDTGSAALVALVPASERDELVAVVEQLGGELWEHRLPPQVVAALREAS